MPAPPRRGQHAMTPDVALQGVTALALGSARFIGCLGVLPPFGRMQLSATHRNILCMGLGLPQAWLLWREWPATPLAPLAVLLLAFKEVLLGMLLGAALSVPYWTFRAAFTLVDNQRGANAAQLANPSLPADSSLLGDLSERALTVVLAKAGLFVVLFEAMAQSYVLWPVRSVAPAWSASDAAATFAFVHAVLLLLSQGLLYAAPVLLCLLLIEFGFAIASMAAQGIPVYENAMPVKSVAALLCIAVYLWTLLDTALPGITVWWQTGALQWLALLR
jgi:type III secretion protein T